MSKRHLIIYVEGGHYTDQASVVTQAEFNDVAHNNTTFTIKVGFDFCVFHI
jgi:hypothetical protein